ncbi:MAG TPA: 4-hydroxybenzoate octaprenyltransferase [Rhizobiaceae bacterium]|nr:4-hydroxybenzoate octaprenyltransferase [Rhizobiaceae bacterium]
MTDAGNKMVADALRGSWVHRFLPERLWPHAQLARWERPIGWQLLLWPCWWAAMLAVNAGHVASTLQMAWYLVLFLVGAVLMRGAGCTYNDLVDEEIDNKVARTRSRPLPSGRISRRDAKLFLLAQLLAAFLVLIQFNGFSIMLGVASLVLVAIYPFMKRITWWPQFFLGLAFSWGALMGWSAFAGSLSAAPLLLYAGSVLWVIAYVTIYALQDIEDDALVGVKSTARLFAGNVVPALSGLYGGAVLLFALSFLAAGVTAPAWIGLAAGALHLVWQVRSLDTANPARCLALFKSNHWFAMILFAGLVLSLALSFAR